MSNRRKQSEVPTRKQLSRRGREERQKRSLYALVGVAALVAVMVLAYGAYQEYIAKPSSPVAIVHGQPIPTRDYQARVRYRRFELASQIATLQQQLAGLDPTNEDQQFLVQYFQQQVQQLQSQSIVLPTQVLDEMIDEELMLQESVRRGISVAPDEMQAEIERLFGFERSPPTPEPTSTTVEGEATPTPVPTIERMSQPEFDKSYSEYVLALRREVGMSEQAFRRLFELNVFRTKLQEALAEEMPSSEEQVHARHVLVETEEEAYDVLDRLAAGEDFPDLADEVSLDTATDGGDLEWFARGQMVSEFEEVAFGLEIGGISAPVETSFGFHIIEVLDRDPNRPLDEAMLEQRKSAALSEWLAEQRQSEAVERYWSSALVPSDG